MFTYKFIIKESRKNDLRLRLTANRRSVEMSLGVRLSPEAFENAQGAKPRPENVRWRSLLVNIQAKVDDVRCELLKGGRRVDVETVRDAVRDALFGKEDEGERESTFIGVFREYIESLGKESTKDVYRHTLGRLLVYDSDVEGLRFEDIGVRWLEDFNRWLERAGNAQNTRGIHLRNIRRVFNYAIDYELTTAYPFRRFKVRPEPTRKRALSVEELRMVFDFPVEEYAEFYRDMFKLIFMLVGINTIDLYGLRGITGDGRIEYKRAKTGRLYSIKVEPEALEVIDRYRGKNGLLCLSDRWGDYRNFRRQCNKALGRMGEVERKGRGGKKEVRSQWPGLTTYWARHTWATVARSIGVSIDDIALALGHGDGHDLTHIYLDEDLQKIDDANRRVLDWVLYGKK